MVEALIFLGYTFDQRGYTHVIAKASSYKDQSNICYTDPAGTKENNKRS